MRRIGRMCRMLKGAVAGAALLAATCLTAFAASSVRLPDGRLLTVWESRSAPRSLDGAGVGSSLAYSIAGPDGLQQGTIPGTADAARDAAPRLAIDPVSGDAVAVWSRFDGVYAKIAYARLEGPAWVDLHDLSFGAGNDTEPRLVVARDGAYLLWISEASHYLFVPVDLSLGHVLAAPRELRLSSHGPSLTTQGGSDVPINLKTHGGKSSMLWSPTGNETVSGGSDVPINLNGNHNKASLWGAGGNPGCRSAIVILPNPTETLLRVFSFTDGLMREIDRVHLPSSIPDGLADQTAAVYVNAYCN